MSEPRMTTVFKVFCLSEVVSPLSHMMGVAGNEALIARTPVVTASGVVWVPRISGNALRHRAIREPGWRYLIQRYDLAGKLTLPQLNYCLHGGNLTEGGGRENLKRIADMQRIFPLSRLIGGCLPDQILAGSLDVWHGRLVCEEDRGGLQADLPDGWTLPVEPLRAAEHFVSGYQYTRGDAAKTASDMLPCAELNGHADEDRKSNLMIFAGQAVTQGACFLHGFTLKHVSRLELGSLLWSLRLWQAAGGTVGGQAARGHGRLKTSYHVDADGEDAVNEYLAHVDAVRDDAVAWLNDVFKPRPEKPKKPKKGSKEPDAETLPLGEESMA